MKIRIKHKTILLAIVSSAGVIATGIAAAMAVPKAINLQEKAEQKKGSELTKKEKVKASIPAYILPVVFSAATITCIMGNSILSERQQTSLASAYGLLSTTYTKYRKKVREIYGEDADKDIIKAIVVDSNMEIWSPGLTGVMNTDFGEHDELRLFYDAFSDRYFESTTTKVLQAQMHLNRNYVLRGLYACVNEWYDFLGLEHIEGGDQIGWVSEWDVQWIDFNNYKVLLEDKPVEASNNYLECNIIEFAFLPDAETFQRNVIL